MWARLYDAVIRASRHPRAPVWLGALSVAESSFFPIPVDVMLAPMVMARRDRMLQFALIATICSVLGGVIGYMIGYFLIDAVTPLLHEYHYWDRYLQASRWFEEHGFWAVLVAGFTPIPYKVFTISAGAGAMPLLPFVAASMVGRGARFFLVALLVRWAGPTFETHLLRYIDLIGWITLALIGVAFVVYRY